MPAVGQCEAACYTREAGYPIAAMGDRIFPQHTLVLRIAVPSDAFSQTCESIDAVDPLVMFAHVARGRCSRE